MSNGLPAKAEKHWYGRVAVACRTEGQHLPELLLGRGQPVDEVIGALAQVADAEPAGEGSRMA